MTATPDASPPVFRIEISSSLPGGENVILSQLPALGVSYGGGLKIYDLYFLEGYLIPDALQKISEHLICDPVTEAYQWRKIEKDRVAAFNDGNAQPLVIEVALRPGVTDNVASELLRAAHRLGIDHLQAVATGTRYEFSGSLSSPQLDAIARRLLVNDTIQRYSRTEITPEFFHPASKFLPPEDIPLDHLDADGLLALSQERRLALNADEMQAVQEYFRGLRRSSTDAELETIAQTWSEHCVHKTFKAQIEIVGPQGAGSQTIAGLLRTYLRAATEKIAASWVRSAFEDNAGVIAFDEDYDLSFKVETHNHPSAIEPFGGANTGVGGVVRDILGVSHRPIATTDVLCFGPSDTPLESLPEGVLHPTRVRTGVVAGIADYGNKLGLPTVNGAVVYHPGYTSNPLVYCGCVGLGPRGAHPRNPRPGDRIIVLGGRTGRDGLRGATFSSLAMDAQTGEVAGASVQIGDPITEKGVIEVVTRARDAGLYQAITDCGAGGLSSAVGEMAARLGARVDLSKVALKYTGLAPWEIWLSEAQERMVLAVPPEKLPALVEICETYWVSWQDIGEFTASGALRVFYGDTPVVDLRNDFLHACPLLRLEATVPNSKFAIRNSQFENPNPNSQFAIRNSQFSISNLLLALLAHPDIRSKEGILRRYDHEVRGATVVRPLVGARSDGPSDAAVLKPLETKGWRGFVLSNGINPMLGEVDPFSMAISVVDEAVRNAVAVGADPDQLALLDNFCWGDPRRPEVLGGLVRAAEGCYRAALHYGAPFISGKDSLNNEYLGEDGARHAIPGTLLISAIAIHPDVRKAVTMDLKSPGDRLYLVGDWQPALAGSHVLLLGGTAFFGGDAGPQKSPVFPESAPRVYRALHTAIHRGLARAAHDLSEGGLAVAAAEMALAGRLGLQLDLSPLDPNPVVALFAETNGCLLVEVAPDRVSLFEDQMADLPLVLLGEVLAEAVVSVRHRGRAALSLPIPDMVEAFTAP